MSDDSVTAAWLDNFDESDILKFRRIIQDYTAAQGPEANRLRLQAIAGKEKFIPTPPYPSRGNPILALLIGRALRLAVTSDPETAIVFVAIHAWMEGYLAGVDHETDTT